MRKFSAWLTNPRVSLVAVAALAAGCAQPSVVNPFLTLADVVGVGQDADDDFGGGGGGGSSGGIRFRDTMVIQMFNNHSEADLNVSFAAWVNISSIRNADQQDALIASGYVQINTEVRFGSAVTLPPGTFVFGGEGAGNAVNLLVAAGECAQICAEGALSCNDACTEIVTPDAMLFFRSPPVSCDSVAFTYTIDGIPLSPPQINDPEGAVFEGATGGGGNKALSQIQGYQCDPFRPGLFLRSAGVEAADNTYSEGDTVQINFLEFPNLDGFAATVSAN